MRGYGPIEQVMGFLDFLLGYELVAGAFSLCEFRSKSGTNIDLMHFNNTGVVLGDSQCSFADPKSIL